jgi:hypothetical protein
LERHTLAEVSQIIKLNFGVFPKEVCDKIAGLLPVPREAIQFAETVNLTRNRRSKLTLNEAVEIVRKREGIQEGGVSSIGMKALRILNEAKDKGYSKKNLCSQIGIAVEEWENDVLPTLLSSERHPAYVSVNNRQMITQEGVKFLNSCR